MSNSPPQVKKVLEQPDLKSNVGPPQLPGQVLNPAADSSRSGRLSDPARSTSDLRSEVKSSTHLEPPPSSQPPSPFTRRSAPQPNIHSKPDRIAPAPSTMSTQGYLGGAASSELKSKLPRKVTPGNRNVAPHPKPVKKTLTESQSTKPGHQPQLHKDKGSTDTPLEVSQEFSTESFADNLPASLPVSNGNPSFTSDAEQKSDREAGSSLLSAAAKNEHEPEEDRSSTASNEDVVSQQGEWEEEDTLFDIIPAGDSLHNSIAKVIHPDFTQSTRTLVSDGDHVTDFDKPGTFQEETGKPKPLDLSLDAIHPLKQEEGDLMGLDGKEARELSNKLKAAEEQIGTLSAENEKQRKQVNEIENRLHSLREDSDGIIAKAKLKVQERDEIIDQKEAETKELLAQVHEKTLAVQDLEKSYKDKCDEYDKLFASADLEHPSESKLGFVVGELARIHEEHEKALEAAEAKFQVERHAYAEIVKQQEEEIEVTDALVVQLESEVAEIRESLHDEEGRAELKEEFLRQMGDDFAALQNALTDLWRREQDLGKPARRHIARLEIDLQKARNEIETVRAEAEQTKKDRKVTIEQLEAGDSALREELGKSQYLNERLNSEAADEAKEKSMIEEEMEKLRFQLSKAQEKILIYEVLGPVPENVDISELKPKNRLSQEQILASSDPKLLAVHLDKAWSKIRDYEFLGLSKTETPMELRALDVIAREGEIFGWEVALAKREVEVERVAGAARVEVLVLKERLGEREMEVRNLKKAVEGLEDDLIHERRRGIQKLLDTYSNKSKVKEVAGQAVEGEEDFHDAIGDVEDEE